ncbi:MAG: Na/Pi cotransporter family protein [Planctomycetaceae bacterium]|nr:MAG: Na/Pi cotransporter family protein [Planctomycetaceae bacterium]
MEISALISLFSEFIGGLGLFLLGMKSMSDGMQAVAGASLRKMISVVTKNRLMALMMGILVTCVVQSSSITTVMTVGFVNSGLMTLQQAVGVIMGANIGTTITGWILVLQIGKYGLPLVGVSAFVFLFSKSDRWRYWGMALMGVGMVFFGLELMKDACAIIKENPNFEEWFHQFQANNYLGVLKCAMVGCLLTVFVQSSSATLGITISLAYQGVISYPTAAALVLGENVGTTVTAFFASLGATTAARRAAYFHIIFNLIGVFWITLIFAFYIRFIQWLLGGNVTEPTETSAGMTYPNTTAAIAATHSIFNIVNTILFFPFVPLLVRMLDHIVPAKDFKEKPHLTDLDIRMLDTPALAIQQSRNEIEKMGDGCEKMLNWLDDLRDQTEPNKALADRLKHREQVFDSVQDEVAAFVTNLLANTLPHSVADEARRQLSLADEYESVSDYLLSLDKFDRKLRRDGFRFTDRQRHDLGELNRHTADYLHAVNLALGKNNRNVLRETDALTKRIKVEIKNLRKTHLEDLSSGEIPPQVSVAFLAALNAYARVRDHIETIAETIAAER